MPVTPIPPRLPDEPAEWYSRFCEWLRMDRPRSVLEIANRERDKANKKRQDSPPGTWNGKPALYKWEERASKWDAKELTRLANEAADGQAKKREQWVAKEVLAAEKLMAKGMAALDIPLVRGQVVEKTKDGEKTTKLPGDPVAFKAGVYALEVASRMYRQALGMVDSAKLWPLLAKYKIPYDALSTEQLAQISAGADPLEVVIQALAQAKENKNAPE